MHSNFDDLPPEVREKLRPMLKAAEEAAATKRRERLRRCIFWSVLVIAVGMGATFGAIREPGQDPNPLWMRVGGGILKGIASLLVAAFAAEFVLKIPFRFFQLFSPQLLFSERDRQQAKQSEEMDKLLHGGCAFVVAIWLFLAVLMQPWW